jgi:phospholipid/cholesterol/gamma-HCH transport system substrate-binding protein
MSTSVRDLAVGCFVLIGIAALAYMSISLGGLSYSGPGGLTLYATFDEIGGLAARAPVVIGGVRVGEVDAVELDADFRARVRLELNSELQLPDDSSVSIYTQGVLGNQYVSLEPGASDLFLKSGDEIAYTQNATVLERLIGRVVQSLGDGS